MKINLKTHLYRSITAGFLLLSVFTVGFDQPSQALQTNGATCASSSPTPGSYQVTLCITAPSTGSTVTGAVPVTVTTTITGTSPGIQRMVYYLDGYYLLTDYKIPYTFTLPSMKWIDGSYTLSVQALMRDGFTTSPTTITINFDNGITSPPVNTKTFQPTSGTSPSQGAPFVVVAGGDGASGEDNASNVVSLLGSLNPNLFLYLGDVYERGTSAEFYNWYGTSNNFGQFRSITDPTIGNHEYLTQNHGAGYFDYWDNIPNYYSFNAGGWHFISLNSNSDQVGVNTQSAQYQWLQQDLAAHAQTCMIAYYHHPLYNIGPEGSMASMAPIWSLLDQYGVSIVLNGHDHDYQRWMPLDGNGQPGSGGITEFVVGTAGHGLQTFVASDNRVAYANDTNPTAFGLLKLSLSSKGAGFQFINTSGTILDSGNIPCAKTSTDTQPPSTPGNVSATASSSSQVNVRWSASNDNVGVSGYTVYRNGVKLDAVSSSHLSYADPTVKPGTIYHYSVDAFDAVGNHSSQSASVSVTTPKLTDPPPGNSIFLPLVIH